MWIALVLVGAACVSVVVFVAGMLASVATMALMGDEVAEAIIRGAVRVRLVHITVLPPGQGGAVRMPPVPATVEELPSRRRHSRSRAAQPVRAPTPPTSPARTWEYAERGADRFAREHDAHVRGDGALRRRTWREQPVDQVLAKSTRPSQVAATTAFWGDVERTPDYPPEYPPGGLRVRGEKAKVRTR